MCKYFFRIREEPVEFFEVFIFQYKWLKTAPALAWVWSLFFFPFYPVHYFTKVNESHTLHENANAAVAQSSLTSITHSAFSFIVAVAACCCSLYYHRRPVVQLGKGVFKLRWQLQKWHWQRWSRVFSQEAVFLFAFSLPSKTAFGAATCEYLCRCWHGQRQAEVSKQSQSVAASWLVLALPHFFASVRYTVESALTCVFMNRCSASSLTSSNSCVTENGLYGFLRGISNQESIK